MNNVLIGSANPDALIAFYSKVLGDPSWRDGLRGRFGLPNRRSDRGSERSRRPGPVLIGFYTEDIVGEFERFEAAGVKVIRAPFRPVDDPEGWLAFLADPDGNYFQLMWPSKGEYPGRPSA